ncbi:dihydrolipoyl dehydrogenase family protein [Clavibacter michiganensis]|uniref:dihydrolipoyl dehydrogenase family protein n=1 Tax=Clavibacter michiganensis TaxID=28447 RepID=UPI000A364ED5|nr:NAD(P)/FAD-dependent oxidoreductase [Clavibacter michiganensis]MDO4098616.1 NAD(P)/FAD-dependent oxidoreductase [Clavibacter michiganensis]MDO4126487.1 NAD(P)/FAD-dependent oxidoreductase [Clavibacter michiganensis]NIY60023.1 pyridine nucleotide-disulfide oxidoreductase [Clavibacter michiganensis subsp. michiganensis]OUE26223.1 Dihydrolipoyl dehydrogenase [Clavibacter michiganensis subsp. michiganensis]QXP03878.1 NAD(P)/FAD-dependent oxidoreductase [Clavibacter michiganensis subsp. michigan
MTSYDLIVIGAGPVGENVADRAKQGGLSVLVVESELVGGECSYWACMPSKALLRSGSALRAARAVAGSKEAVTGELDVAAVLKRRDSFTSSWDDQGQVSWLEGIGIDLARGHGRISGPRRVTVTAPDGSVTEHEAAHAVVVSTGTAALLPDIPGLAESQPWTSREATSVEVVPTSIVVIGGGVVAAEMATAFASLGSAVTLVARSGLLSGQEPFAGELVGDSLRDMGVDVRLGGSPSRVTRDGDEVTVELSDGSAVTAAEVLVATGRTPRTEDLGLDAVGLEAGAYLDVDDTMLVTGDVNAETPWLYAVGDVNHRALLTHQGKYQARAAGEVIAARATGGTVDDAPWGVHVATADHRAVPQVTFTDPEVASVGLTAKAAEEAGIRMRVVDYDLGSVAGSSLHADGYAGKARMVVDEDRGVIVGVTFVGQDVAELLHSATIAVVGEVPVTRLWHAVPSYPTISEVWLRLLETYGRPTA